MTKIKHWNLGSTGMAKTPPYPYRVPRGYGYCRGTVACVPPAYPFSAKKKKFLVRFWYGSGWVQYGFGTGRGKTEPKRRRFKVNLKPIYLLHPILSHLFSSATPLSLFSALDLSCMGTNMVSYPIRVQVREYIIFFKTYVGTRDIGYRVRYGYGY